MRRQLAAALVLLSVASAQTPSAAPSLTFTGTPLQLETRCTMEQVNDLGLACSADDPCAAFLELTTVAAAGPRVFLAGNLHTESTTIATILLASDDGGRTWTEPASRVPAAGLDDVQFVDDLTGWAGGQRLRVPPRDPFVLLTTDGGRTWRRRSVADESRPGIVEIFHFRSRTEGALVVDRGRSAESGNRYELYETMTGGESWMLRAVTTTPPSVPRTPSPTEWRLRVDEKAGAHRLERRQAGQWQAVAAFAVRAQDCQPAEAAPAALPPP